MTNTAEMTIAKAINAGIQKQMQKDSKVWSSEKTLLNWVVCLGSPKDFLENLATKEFSTLL